MEIKRVISRRDLRTFIHLPAKIHRNHSNWLPPVYADEYAFFNPRKNRSFSYSDTVLALACIDGKTAGRIMGIINRKYNESRKEDHARFGYFECYNNPVVAAGLLSYISQWAKGLGCTKLVGPYGFSDKDPQGFMIEGFDYPPLIAAPTNEQYMVAFMEQNGFQKEVDCLAYLFDITRDLPEIYTRLENRMQANTAYRVLEFKNKKQLKPYIIPLFSLMNETYSDLYGFVPLDEKEMLDFARRYMPILDPRFIKVIEYGDTIAGFIIGIPSMVKGIQKAKGYLFPLGIFHILAAAKKATQLDLMLGAVKRQYQGLGFEIPMALKLIGSMKSAGFTRMEIHLVLETNLRMLAELDRAGARPHKRFRVFGKSL